MAFVKFHLLFLLFFGTSVVTFRLVQDKQSSKVPQIRKSDLLKDEIEKFLNKTVIRKDESTTRQETTEKRKPNVETKIVTKSVTNQSDFNEMLKKIEEIKAKPKIIDTKDKKVVPERKPEIVKIVNLKENFTEPISTVVEPISTQNIPKILTKDGPKIAKTKLTKEELEARKKEIKASLKEKKDVPPPEPQKPLPKVTTSDKDIKQAKDTKVKKAVVDEEKAKANEERKMKKAEVVEKMKQKINEEKDAKRAEIKAELKKEAASQKLLVKVTSDKVEAEKVEVKKAEVKVAEPKKEAAPLKPLAKVTSDKVEVKPKVEVKKAEVKIEKAEVKKKVDVDVKPSSSQKSKSEKKTSKVEKKVDKKEMKVEKKVEAAKGKSEKVVKVAGTVAGGILEDFSYVPDFSVVKDECHRQGVMWIENLRSKKLWAMKMFDSSAKLPSNILKGNLNQLGDFDQCLSVHGKIPLEDKATPTIATNQKDTAHMMKINGKYCLAYVDLEATEAEMKLPVNLAQGRAFVRSKNTDPGHFAPKFTSIKWGMCIPSACSHEDAKIILEDMLPNNLTTGVRLHVNIPEEECQVLSRRRADEFHFMTFISIILIATLASLTVVATIRDYIKHPNTEEDTSHQILMAFSLKRTIHTLLEDGKDEIPCIHGIRTICTILLYIAHKVIPIGHQLYTNRVYVTEIANSPGSIILRMSVIYTDTFLLLSGILTAYHMSKDMETKGYIPWINRIFARVIRLSPILLIVLIYYAYIMEFTGDGPLWPSVIRSNAELCKEGMWKNLLFVQNFYPFEEMCATHTHQLALDMQLFLIAPILVWLLYSKPFLGVVITLLLHVVSVVLRYYTTINYRLSLVIYHGISLSQLYRTANYLYASSIHRATPYLAGIGLGVLLRQLSPEARIPKVISVLGWISAGYFIGWTLYTPSHLALRSYQYDLSEAAQFSALCSLAWALALSWIIFASHINLTGYLNQFLSSKPMVLLSRLSYTIYLTQFIVFFYNVGTIRGPEEFSLFELSNLAEFVIVTIVSLATYLVIDLPTQKIKNILLKPSPTKKESETEEKVENESEAKIESTEATEINEENLDYVMIDQIEKNQEEFEEKEDTVTDEDLTIDEELDDIEEIDMNDEEIEEHEKLIEYEKDNKKRESRDERQESFEDEEHEDEIDYKQYENVEDLIDFGDDDEERDTKFETKEIQDLDEMYYKEHEKEVEPETKFETKEVEDLDEIDYDEQDDIEVENILKNVAKEDDPEVEVDDASKVSESKDLKEKHEEEEIEPEEVEEVKITLKRPSLGNNKPGALPLMDEILDVELSEDEEEEE